MYKARLKKGVTRFGKGGLLVDWSKATQEQMKLVYEMVSDLVTKEEDAKPKKKKSKAKENNSTDKE